MARRAHVGLRARLVGAGGALPPADGGGLAVHDRPRLVPLELARPAIRRTLSTFARRQTYEILLRKRLRAALSRTICLRDDLPSPAVVSVSTYLPFLALSS